MPSSLTSKPGIISPHRSSSDNLNALPSEIRERFLAHLQQKLPIYLKESKRIIGYSATRKNMILVIDKAAHKCFVFESGILSMTCSIDMGPRWHESSLKIKGATPEGTFYCIGKREQSDSEYYKTVLLNISPGNQREAINLHGGGVQNKNWTNGSIAFSNKVLDSIYENIKLGTLILIAPGLGDEFESQYA